MKKKYSIENPMAPLWIMYPEMGRYSMGWRMGDGEGYRYEFCNWYKSLNKEEKEKYQELFPEAIGWQGWYNEKHTDNDIYDGEGNLNWNENGTGKIGYSVEKVKKDHNCGKKIKYIFFWGHRPNKNGEVSKSCFSQWWNSEFIIDGDKYYFMEQYMMAEKARLFKDEEILNKILDSKNPGEIKALGRKVKDFNEDIWLKNRYSIVLRGNYQKFIQDKKLKEFLINTKNRVLVEASPYDKIWGIGMSQDDENIKNPFKWNGLNLLGFALMEVREELIRVCKNEELIDFE